MPEQVLADQARPCEARTAGWQESARRGMKSRREVQRAHDILKAILLKEVPIDHDDGGERLKLIHSALDTLCWVLEHGHNSTFADNLALIETALAEKGFVLREVQ